MSVLRSAEISAIGGKTMPAVGFPGIAVGTAEFAGEAGQAKVRMAAAQQPQLTRRGPDPLYPIRIAVCR